MLAGTAGVVVGVLGPVAGVLGVIGAIGVLGAGFPEGIVEGLLSRGDRRVGKVIEQAWRDHRERSGSVKCESTVLEVAIVARQLLQCHPAITIGVNRLEVEGDVNVRPAEVSDTDQWQRRTARFRLVDEAILVAVQIREQGPNVVTLGDFVSFFDGLAIDLDVQANQDRSRRRIENEIGRRRSGEHHGDKRTEKHALAPG